MNNATPLAASAVPATVDHLSRHAPFDRMEREDLAHLASRLTLAYYGRGEVLLAPEDGVPGFFYIIRQGVVQGEQGLAEGEDAACWELTEGECFPLGALLAKRPVNSTYRAREDTFCYQLPLSEFEHLLEKSHPFRDFCTRRIASLLEESKRLLQAHYSQAGSERQSLESPLASLMRQNPYRCPPTTPLREVLATLQEKRIGSMVIVDEADHPLGIFTLHDVLERVTLAGRALDTPIEAVMTPAPISLPPHAPAFEAALVMARHGFRHVLVSEAGKLVGLVSEKDLFRLQRIGLRQVGNAIRAAQNLDELTHAAADIRELGHNMLAQGVGAEQLTQILSTLNDLLTQRLIEQELRDETLAQRFCWLALGSEGRLEQTLNTDQDNGIIFEAREGEDADALREKLLGFARRVNEGLAACGFPLCRGEVMASNPKWCLTREEWQDTFADWMFRGDAPVLLNATIFFDFRPLYGRADLADALRAWLNAHIRENRLFLRHMAENALRNRPPLGLVRDFAVGEDHALDLKLNGITPFVDAARVFGLHVGAREAGTVPRLYAAAAHWHLDPAEVSAWADAFQFIQLLRLRLQHEQAAAGQPPSNRLDPDTLNPLDRRILKETFRQARKLQALLEKYFQF